jgi:hypothetical protein
LEKDEENQTGFFKEKVKNMIAKKMKESEKKRKEVVQKKEMEEIIEL